MKLTFSNPFFDQGKLKELRIFKCAGKHSRLFASVEYAEADIIPDLSDLLGGLLSIRVEDKELQADLFSGIITAVELVDPETQDASQAFRVTAHSESIRMDLVPKNRVFQDPGGTLQSIISQVLEKGLTRAERGKGNFSTPVPLSVQFEETDFQYMKRLLGSYGIPVLVDDTGGTVYLGNRNTPSHKIDSKDQAGTIYTGNLAPLLGGESYAVSAGRIGEMQNAVSAFSKSLFDRNQYFSSSIHPESENRQKTAMSASDLTDFSTNCARIHLTTRRVFMGTGDRVQLDDENEYTVVDTQFQFIWGQDRRLTFNRQHYRLADILELSAGYDSGKNSINGMSNTDLEDLQLPFETHLQGRPLFGAPWQTRIFIAKVTKNQGDPENLGRIQVRFDWETSEPEESRQCWVDVMTPFAGDGDKTYGFLMLPEVGEQVLVRFLEPGDDKPVIIGSLRRKTVVDTLDTGQHKVIRTPSGNCFDLVTMEDKDIVRMRAGQSDGFHLTVETKNNRTKITLDCNDTLLLKGRDVKIQGRTVNVESQTSIRLNADTSLSVSSKTGTKINSTGAIQIRGTMIDLN